MLRHQAPPFAITYCAASGLTKGSQRFKIARASEPDASVVFDLCFFSSVLLSEAARVQKARNARCVHARPPPPQKTARDSQGHSFLGAHRAPKPLRSRPPPPLLTEPIHKGIQTCFLSGIELSRCLAKQPFWYPFYFRTTGCVFKKSILLSTTTDRPQSFFPNYP